MKGNKYLIGYVDNGYPSFRMIYKKIKGVDYIKISGKNDMRYAFFHICSKLLKNCIIEKKREIYAYQYNPFIKKEIDVIHIFNGICQNKRVNWVSTFEAQCPVYLNYSDILYRNIIINAVEKIKMNNCKAILFMSEWSKNKTLLYWNKLIPDIDYRKCINKMLILPPPQEVLINKDEIIDKFNDIDNMEFVFVGNDFWRKGGMELLHILNKYATDYNFKLTIISNLSYTKYYTLSTHKDEREVVEKYINDRNWIDLKSELKNEEVLKILKKSHIGFLPTYADTYGFSVLEMQAAGCPVVTTDVSALKEINNNDVGWIMETDINYMDEKYEQKMQKKILENLDKIMFEILNCKSDELKNKAFNAVNKIKNVNSPQMYEKKLFEVYNKNMENMNE